MRCVFCGKEIKSIQGYQGHLKQVHLEELEEYARFKHILEIAKRNGWKRLNLQAWGFI